MFTLRNHQRFGRKFTPKAETLQDLRGGASSMKTLMQQSVERPGRSNSTDVGSNPRGGMKK